MNREPQSDKPHPSSPTPHPSRVAIVTGAAQGLGRALAVHLASAGYRVAAADLREAEARETARSASEQSGIPALGLRADVTSEADVAALFRRTEAELGPVDLLVANAGIVQSGETAEFPLEAWRRVIDVNLTGYFLCAREAARA